MTSASNPAVANAGLPGLENVERPTIRDLLRIATAVLTAAGKADAATDARRLAAHALGVEPAVLLGEPLFRPDAGAVARFSGAVARRLAHEPVARIIGERAFYGLDLELGPATLDPRPDTETVVALAAHLAPRIEAHPGGTLRILDLGTGTGAIAIALLSILPQATAVGIDISAAALDVARRNAARHGVADRIQFVEADWLGRVDGVFDLVVANPPYIPSGDIQGLDREVAAWDPTAALDGGGDGLDAYRAILPALPGVLTPSGWGILEVGHGQASDVAALAAACALVPAPLDWPMLRDLGGKVRCVAVATPGCDVKKTLGIADRSD